MNCPREAQICFGGKSVFLGREKRFWSEGKGSVGEVKVKCREKYHSKALIFRTVYALESEECRLEGKKSTECAHVCMREVGKRWKKEKSVQLVHSIC